MIEIDRLSNANVGSSKEDIYERSLRPRDLNEYVGQEKVREQLSIFIKAAIARGKHSIMYFYLDLRGSVKQRWRISLQRNWE